jgi:hypothetical protein
MTKLGKTALALTVLALIGGFVLAAMLGKYHNEWSVNLASARTSSDAAIVARDQAKLELLIAQSELSRTKLGWGFEWVLNGANAPQIQNGALIVQGVGTNNGLTVKTTTDEQGQQKQVAPVVHVFSGTAEGGAVYLGEFIADPQQISPTSCTLIPQWNVGAPEIATWDFRNGIRLRSQIPPAERAAVEGVYRLIQRTQELIRETNRNIASQETLLASVQEQLDFRKKELLGNPDMTRIAERPEYSDGLVKALVDTEEDRNSLQVSVDALRRMIKQAADERVILLEQLDTLVSQLPQPAERVSKKP